MRPSARSTLSLLAAASAMGMAGPVVPGAAAQAPVEMRADADFRLSDLHLAGVAHRIERDDVELVGPGSGLAAGGAYTPDRVDVAGFGTRFMFRIGRGCADGIAAVVQGEGPDALGGGGGTIGYGSSGDGEVPGIERSIAVEVDLWQNIATDFGADGVDDPRVPHVSLQTRGVTPNDANPLYSLSSRRVHEIGSNEKHRVRLAYDNSKLRVFVDGHRRARYDVDLASELGLADGTAYVGVTAGGGGCSAPVDVLRFQLNRRDAEQSTKS